MDREEADSGGYEAVRGFTSERAGSVGACPKRSLLTFSKGQGGFTLVEMLVTVVVLSRVLAIATSTYQRVVQGRGVEADTTQLVADLRLAHSKATNQLTAYEVVLNADSSVYTVGPTGVPATRQLNNESVVDTTMTLTFQPNGTVEPTGMPVTCNVTSSRGSLSHEVEVVPATARVQIDP